MTMLKGSRFPSVLFMELLLTGSEGHEFVMIVAKDAPFDWLIPYLPGVLQKLLKWLEEFDPEKYLAAERGGKSLRLAFYEQIGRLCFHERDSLSLAIEPLCISLRDMLVEKLGIPFEEWTSETKVHDLEERVVPNGSESLGSLRDHIADFARRIQKLSLRRFEEAHTDGEVLVEIERRLVSETQKLLEATRPLDYDAELLRSYGL